MSDLALPHLLNALVDAAGVARVLAFAGECGGKRLSVPKYCGDGHRLVVMLGRAGADRLCEMYGGEVIDVPMGPAGTLAAARRRIADALAAGASVDQAAGRAGLHRRTVQRVRARLKAVSNDPQGSLF